MCAAGRVGSFVITGRTRLRRGRSITLILVAERLDHLVGLRIVISQVLLSTVSVLVNQIDDATEIRNFVPQSQKIARKK